MVVLTDMVVPAASAADVAAAGAGRVWFPVRTCGNSRLLATVIACPRAGCYVFCSVLLWVAMVMAMALAGLPNAVLARPWVAGVGRRAPVVVVASSDRGRRVSFRVLRRAAAGRSLAAYVHLWGAVGTRGG